MEIYGLILLISVIAVLFYIFLPDLQHKSK